MTLNIYNRILLTETIDTFIHSEPISILITAKLYTLVICKQKTKSVDSTMTYFKSGMPILKNARTYLFNLNRY